jgi:hypothetical protein
MADCLHFHRPDGSRHPYNSGAPAVLVAFGQYDLVRLRQSNIAGTLVVQWQRLGQRREDLLDWRASARPRSKEPTPTRPGGHTVTKRKKEYSVLFPTTIIGDDEHACALEIVFRPHSPDDILITATSAAIHI